MNIIFEKMVVPQKVSLFYFQPKSSQSRRTKRKPSPLCDNNAPIKTGNLRYYVILVLDTLRKQEAYQIIAQLRLNFLSTSGDATIDGHSAPSTLGGETGAMVDKFRQLKLKEYNDIVKLCKLNSVPLTEDLLKRGKCQINLHYV